MSPSPHRRRTAPLVLAAVTALLLVPACSDGDDNSPSTTSSPAYSSPASPPATADAVRITMKNFAFSPATLTVKAGEKITVVNEDSAAHTVTATQGEAFDTGTIDGGKTGTLTAPSQSGSYSFVCTLHPEMKGTLTVR
ncbi:metal-binding protein [Streptomyces sp. HC44]|uniref:Metal-binding protein n=1 Tax=Streptomyces scabichelini TaxID=2711217 RepID=A0A6G4UYI0_9ACTN|nr:cupredoxin domain-containing protein [Streptomyces scabichelini]NGO06720.1 metal-binding protein [Streptomyces scabichelini]